MTEEKHMSTAKRAFFSLTVLALLAVVLQSLLFSGASFTSASGNPGNIFAAGTLSHMNDRDGVIVLDATGLRPGESRSGEMTITGGGDVTGLYSLVKATLVDDPAVSGLSSVLTMRIEDVTSATAILYDGTVAAFTTVSIGTISPGGSRAYRITLTFPSAGATSAMQGATMQLGLQVTGASS